MVEIFSWVFSQIFSVIIFFFVRYIVWYIPLAILGKLIAFFIKPKFSSNLKLHPNIKTSYNIVWAIVFRVWLPGNVILNYIHLFVGDWISIVAVIWALINVVFVISWLPGEHRQLKHNKSEITTTEEELDYQ